LRPSTCKGRRERRTASRMCFPIDSVVDCCCPTPARLSAAAAPATVCMQIACVWSDTKPPNIHTSTPPLTHTPTHPHIHGAQLIKTIRAWLLWLYVASKFHWIARVEKLPCTALPCLPTTSGLLLSNRLMDAPSATDPPTVTTFHPGLPTGPSRAFGPAHT
jgi:hypothetical protein